MRRRAACLFALALAGACGPVATEAPISPPAAAASGDLAPSGTPSPTPVPVTTPSASASSGFLPAPDRPLPRPPSAFARDLARTTTALRAAVGRWVGEDAAPQAAPPREVVLLALYQQRMYRALGHDALLTDRVLSRLPPRLRGEARANVSAIARLASLIRPTHGPVRLRTKPPDPPALLLRSYHRAERRFGVAWEVLAAVNFIESKFGRARSASPAGAQGPMQFLPATWAAYGLGGDVHDPRDAILGAANYLRASGAPADYGRALYAYNRAQAYVDAVLLYARRIREDPRAFFEYYNWQVFVITEQGDRRLTGPGVGYAGVG